MADEPTPSPAKEAAKPSTDHEWMVHALNIHGIFFERWCEELIGKENGWRVEATQVPVEYPPGRHAPRDRESALDILAESWRLNSAPVRLLIEAKKNNPEFVRWVFFPTSQPGMLAARIVTTEGIPRERLETPHWHVESSLMGFQTGSVTVTNAAREVRGDYVRAKGNDKTKTSNTAVADASYQVALALQSIVDEDVRRLRAAAMSPVVEDEPSRWIYYVPAIVTTAELLVCRFEPIEVSDRNGEIPYEAARFDPVEYLVYEYALPRHLHAWPGPQMRAQPLVDDRHRLFERMPIFVVQARSLGTFLRGLNNDRNLIAIHPRPRVTTVLPEDVG